MHILDVKYIPSNRTGYTLTQGFFEISNNNKTLEHILPNIVKVSITTDDIRLKCIIYNDQTLIFTKNLFLYNVRLYSKPSRFFKQH